MAGCGTCLWGEAGAGKSAGGVGARLISDADQRDGCDGELRVGGNGPVRVVSVVGGIVCTNCGFPTLLNSTSF